MYNCCFSINTPDAEPEMGRGMAEGGMKVLSLSLLKKLILFMSVLSVCNLIKKYNKKPVTNDVSFQVNAGEIVGLLRP